jgi:Xaa-Pro aminopeptidase
LDYLTIAEYGRIKEALSFVETVGVDQALLTARAIKTEQEIDLIAKSQQINEIALTRTLAAAKPRMTERELCAEYSYQLLKAGADGYSFDPIVAGGAFTAQPHHKVSDYCIEKNDPILFDVGGKFCGYCSDMTRTVCLGDPGREMKRIYKIVLEAQLYVLSKLKAGMTCHEADSLAREMFAAHGLDQYFGHSLGHGVGIDIHEDPRVGKNNQVVLQESMVVTVEPGIYIDGVGGVRIEDMVVITKDGVRNLTSFHKKFEI